MIIITGIVQDMCTSGSEDIYMYVLLVHGVSVSASWLL